MQTCTPLFTNQHQLNEIRQNSGGRGGGGWGWIGKVKQMTIEILQPPQTIQANFMLFTRKKNLDFESDASVHYFVFSIKTLQSRVYGPALISVGYRPLYNTYGQKKKREEY